MGKFNIYALIVIGILGALPYRFVAIKYRAVYLAFLSIFIYILWGSWATILLLTEILAGWVSYTSISRKQDIHKKNQYMVALIAFVTIILLAYKYIFANIMEHKYTDVLALVVPIGISYYSFKIISFIADVYWGKIEYVKFTDYVAYISLFPQIALGPISRYDEIEPYLCAKVSFLELRQAGYRICKGIFYKFVIANRLSAYNNTVFIGYKNYPSIALIMAVFFYGIELYADFCGYSEIAIGICELYGFKIRDNFKQPYFSVDIKDFWKRWHISLSSWLRDYIYIPMGGNRKGKIRQKLNIFVVFLVSAVWHGNTIPYLIWGMWHGILNIMPTMKTEKKSIRIISTIFTFVAVNIGWLCFRFEDINDILSYIYLMFSSFSISYENIVSSIMPFSRDYSSLAKLLTILLLILVTSIMELQEHKEVALKKESRAIIYIIAIVFFGVFGQNGFIYAGF